MTKKLKSTIKYDPNTRSNSKSKVTLATCKTKKHLLSRQLTVFNYKPESKTLNLNIKHILFVVKISSVTKICPLENKGKQVNSKLTKKWLNPEEIGKHFNYKHGLNKIMLKIPLSLIQILQMGKH